MLFSVANEISSYLVVRNAEEGHMISMLSASESKDRRLIGFGESNHAELLNVEAEAKQEHSLTCGTEHWFRAGKLRSQRVLAQYSSRLPNRLLSTIHSQRGRSLGDQCHLI